MTLDNLLTPTMLVAVVSGTLAFIQFQKSNSLKYITEERQKWRTEIRDIIVKIEESDDVNTIRPNLSFLKSRINAYGLTHSKSYNKDFHIWQTIKQLEKPKNDEFFQFDKQLLINFLALLLKSDWERSKIEVEGNRKSNFNDLLFIISIILFVFMSTTDFKEMLSATINGAQLSEVYLIPIIIYLGISIIVFLCIGNSQKISFESLINQQKEQNSELSIKQVQNSIAHSKSTSIYIPMIVFLICTIWGSLYILDISEQESLFTSIFIKTITICILWIISSISNFELNKAKISNLQAYYFSVNSLISIREHDLYPGKQNCCSYKINKNEINDFE